MADGPRALRDNEWGQLNDLVSAVFRPEMFHNYPQLFNEPNRDNLRVVADDGKVVTHVGFTQRRASLAGCLIHVACIGAVATYHEYRGHGFASQAFQDCCDKAAADGVDVMLISGGRGLYTRVGCRQVGQDHDYALEPGDAIDRLWQTEVHVAPLGPDHIGAMQAIHQTEPVRFVRPREDWELAFNCGIVMNTASDFWGVWLDRPGEARAPVAYVICHQPDKIRRRSPEDPRQVRIVEYAGDRAAVLAALPRLLGHYDAQRVALHVRGGDVALHGRLQALGVAGSESGSSGTLRVINFPQLMERVRPLLVERIGNAAGALRFDSDERPGSATGTFTIRSGGEALSIGDLADLAELLFGHPKRQAVATQGSRRIGQLLQAALPLPALWYGINYV